MHFTSHSLGLGVHAWTVSIAQVMPEVASLEDAADPQVVKQVKSLLSDMPFLTHECQKSHGLGGIRAA